MKCIALVLTLLVASITCSPNPDRQPRFVDRLFENAIADLRQNITDRGLDPLVVEKHFTELDDFPLLSGPIIIEDLLSTGLSNIVVNSVNYSTLRRRLTFDVSMPEIFMSLGNANIDLVVVGNRVQGNANGRLSVNQIRLTGEVRMNIGIISGVSITGVDVSFTLGGIQSALDVAAQGTDFSESINGFLEHTVPTYVKDNTVQINDAIEDIIWSLMDE